MKIGLDLSLRQALNKYDIRDLIADGLIEGELIVSPFGTRCILQLMVNLEKLNENQHPPS